MKMHDSTKINISRVKIDHEYSNPLLTAVEIYRGLSLYRALFHYTLRTLKLEGKVLDLGGKSSRASYYSHIKKSDDCIIISTDINPTHGVVALNIEQVFPFKENEFDYILAFNIFEHVYDLNNYPFEINRVLKTGGKLIICVPFLHEFHADPDDFYRFTSSALLNIWSAQGLKCNVIFALGEGLLTFVATKILSNILPKILYSLVGPLIYLLLYPLDRIVALRPEINGLSLPKRFPLGYYAIFTKPFSGI